MINLFPALVLCCAASGCATVNHMAIDKTSRSVDVSAKSVLLVSLDLSHLDNTYYVPRALVVNVETPNAQSKEDRQNFKVDEDGMASTEAGHNTYVLRMALAPGKYQIKGIFGNNGRFPFHGFFFIPLLMDIDVPANSIVYMGRLEAVLRPRQGGEFRAGSIIPLVDQAVTGVSGGTFDVVVRDAFETDVPIMQSTFPSLATTEIKKALLPAFDRQKVQQWWDSDGKNAKPVADTKDAPTDRTGAQTKSQ